MQPQDEGGLSAADILQRARSAQAQSSLGRTQRRGDADTPAFPFYSRKLDSAGRFIKSNMMDTPRDYARDVYEEANDIASELGSRLLTTAIKAMAVFAWLGITLALSVVIYAGIYWFVVPQKEYNFPLYFDYGAGAANYNTAPQQHIVTTTTYVPLASESSGSTVGDAGETSGHSTSFMMQVSSSPAPLASIDLLSSHSPWNISDLGASAKSDGGKTVGKRLLASGQPYTATVRLVLPESPSNLMRQYGNSGAFMLNIELLTLGDKIMARSARPVVMQYRSWPIQIARWTMMAPAFLVGLLDESQTHSLICFDKYIESAEHPLTGVRVWLSDSRVQVYRADLFIIAELKGLGYYMYHWFFFSWIFGVGIILFWNLLASLILYAVCCISSKEGVSTTSPSASASTIGREDKTSRVHSWSPYEEVEYEDEHGTRVDDVNVSGLRRRRWESGNHLGNSEFRNEEERKTPGLLSPVEVDGPHGEGLVESLPSGKDERKKDC